MPFKVDHSMTRKVQTIDWDESLLNAYQMMKGSKIRHLPVLRNKEVVGVISDRDLQRAMNSDFEWKNITAFESAEFPKGSMVRDYMNWPVLTVDRGQDLRSVVKMMMIDKISSVIVTDQGALAGIITTQDLLRVLLDLLSGPESERKFGMDKLLDEEWIDAKSMI